MWAFENGYDSIIIHNVVEGVGGGPFTEVIVNNPNQIKNADNLQPTESDDIRYSVKKDSTGKKLTKEQAEYFKDSKAVDDSGNLKPSDIKYSTKPTGVENISVYEDRGYHNLWIKNVSGAIQLSFNDFDTEAEAIAFAKKHAETLPRYISESNNPDEFEDATDSVQMLSKKH